MRLPADIAVAFAILGLFLVACLSPLVMALWAVLF